ncbi:MAG: hypothetical protein JJO71_32065 [Escherichia coli]|jgi:hypothetical protein|uniref:Uncharacterized protein n=1 Tax=Escherichia coli M605 TaxID=656417 RepID=F4T7M8_ECOLX|nr:conserved hypothetical protein [Escherichia coli M605]ENE04536.1 hypothetical protein ECP03047993_3358 [Escherichia coli P0304799.3]MBL1008257.1 hypothetical protein [Escherichia coli]OSL82225.1 hypothetical protein EAZG_04523 [Escherichia coli TA249]
MPQEAYFDAPDLERLILDVRSNPGFVSPGESNQNQKQITRNVERGSLVT